MNISFIVINQDINMISYHLRSYWHCLSLYLLPWRVCMTSLFVIFWEDFLTANSMAIVNRSDRLTLRAPAISYHTIFNNITKHNIKIIYAIFYHIILYHIKEYYRLSHSVISQTTSLLIECILNMVVTICNRITYLPSTTLLQLSNSTIFVNLSSLKLNEIQIKISIVV